MPSTDRVVPIRGDDTFPPRVAAAINALITAALPAPGSYQAADADLTAIAALTSAADRVLYATGSNTWALATFTSAARTLLAAASAAAQRTALVVYSTGEVDGLLSPINSTLSSHTSSISSNTTAIAGKLAKVFARNATDTAAAWRTDLTGVLTTTVQNISEHYVTMKASANVSSFLSGYVNEWGALRGTSPYTWGDSLIRAIRQTGDGITAGNLIELEDRTVTAYGVNMKRWGRRWVDGALVRNSYPVVEVYRWKTGDADPTNGGTVALPAGASWIIQLSTLGGSVPSWVPADALIIEPSS